MKFKIFIPIIVLIILSFNVLSSPSGGTITYDRMYVIHTFTTNGTFNPNGNVLNLEVLVVAGGGAGSGSGNLGASGGGGGAGGLIYNTSYIVSSNISVIVGNGGIGSGNVGSEGTGGNGTNSSFGSIVTKGGGGGGTGGGTHSPGAAGGSGGGGGGSTGAGGTAVSGQGNNGGTATGTGPNYGSAGGGGAGSVGATGTNTAGGNGGTGLNFSINGTLTNYSCGGGGAVATAGTQGLGGCSCAGTAVLDGTGGNANSYGCGGGGSGTHYPWATQFGGNGSQGIVIIRYIPSTYILFGNITYSSVGFQNANISLLSSQGISVLDTTVSNSTGGYSFNSLRFDATYYLLLASYYNITSMLSASSYVYINNANQTKNLEFITTTATNCVVDHTNWFFVPDGCVSSS